MRKVRHERMEVKRTKLECLIISAGSTEELNEKISYYSTRGYFLLHYEVHPSEFFLIFTALLGSPEFSIFWKA